MIHILLHALLQEALCTLLDDGGHVLLELTTCREASQKSPRSFWAFRRLGYLQVKIVISGFHILM